MDLMMKLDIRKLSEPIRYGDKIMLIGSCFTEHIGNDLAKYKFNVLQNPNGILFGPDSVCKSLLSYIPNKQYKKEELFRLNEVWYSWQHHSRFSAIDDKDALQLINASQNDAHKFLKNADWLIITLGSSFTYRLTGAADKANESEGNAVANCHRAPAAWFSKEMLKTGEIITMLEDCLSRVQQFNPALKIIFTVSPVRHHRDGLIENNRSKARLIEAVQHIVENSTTVFYFPAYEIVIDVLRDYRYYDIDFVHPNYLATNFVLEKFTDACIHESSKELMEEVRKIVTARKHRAFQPNTNAHKEFLRINHEKAKELQEKHSCLDLKEEIDYFSR